MAVSKEDLLAAPLPRETVPVPGLGDVVVRGLSRTEVVKLQEKATEPDALDNGVVAVGLLEPALTPAEVVKWRASAPNEHVKVVSDAILTLSGLAEGQQEEAEARFRPGDGT
jgi:hypothetical protein